MCCFCSHLFAMYTKQVSCCHLVLLFFFSLSLSSSFTTLALFDVILDKSIANICEHFFLLFIRRLGREAHSFSSLFFFLHLSVENATTRRRRFFFFCSFFNIYQKQQNSRLFYQNGNELSVFFLLCFYRSSYFKHDIRKRIMFIYIEIRRSSLENCNNGRESSRISYH